MKKGVLFSVVFLLLSFSLPFVFAVDEPSPLVGEDDAKRLQGVIDDNAPIGEDGNFNITKFKLNETRAERVIGEVNGWLSGNAYWLWVVFGMVPQISWLFVFNVWLWLLFFTALVINGNHNISDEKGRLIGLGVFVALLGVKFYYVLARGLAHMWDIVWNVIIPWGVYIAVPTIIVLLILAVWFWPVTLRLVAFIVRYIAFSFRPDVKARLAQKVLERELEAREKAR